MNSFTKFLRATLTGGVLFLLPVVLVVVIFNKAFHILKEISRPLNEKMPDIIFGLYGSNLLTILLLVVICFFSGLMFRSSWVRNRVAGLEENVLSFLPGYALLKSVASDAIGEKSETKMTTVLVRDGEVWNIGFLVEEVGDLCTVFIPDVPRHDAGETKIVRLDCVNKTDVTTNKATHSLKRYGKGAIGGINAG
jgi:uncharacterized membrane protein